MITWHCSGCHEATCVGVRPSPGDIQPNGAAVRVSAPADPSRLLRRLRRSARALSPDGGDVEAAAHDVLLDAIDYMERNS